jgi:ketosteroid isomerase-like protein
MSAHIELIRRGQLAFKDGDMSPMRPHLSPDVEWGSVDAFPGLRDTYHGPDGVDEWMATVRSSFEDFEVTLERVIRDEDEFAVVAEHLRGVGRESGAEVEMAICSVYWFRDGKIFRRRGFTTEDQALAAVG